MIEDDAELAKLLVKFLERYNMSVINFTDPIRALDSFEINSYSLVILDLTLPTMDGLDVCKALRLKSNIPIIISSARSDTMDKVIGLELGADDYLPKPYEPIELVARVKAILRRESHQFINSSEFEIDKDRMSIKFHSKELNLTLAEYEILNLLLENRGSVVTREYIANNSDSINWNSSDRSIDVIVSRVRAKLNDDSKSPKYIKSIRGIGYKFIV
jgi:two-component system OmpR family response regulator